jgi:Flp pilus assembly protein TadG
MIAPLFRRLIGFCRDSSAATSAEFALVVPFFIVLVFGTINTSIAVAAVTQVHYAAERSARCLSTSVIPASTAGSCAANIDTYAKAWYRGPELTGLVFTPFDDPTCGNRVTGSGDYAILTGFESTTVRISGTACYPKI